MITTGRGGRVVSVVAWQSSKIVIPGSNPAWREIIPALIVIQIQLYVPYSPWMCNIPSRFAAGSKDDRGYKPTIRERQSPSLSKDPSWVRKERIPTAELGRWSNKKNNKRKTLPNCFKKGKAT